MNWYFPNLEAVTDALIETRRQFSPASQRAYHDLTVYKSWMLDFPTSADREKANRFDSQKALHEAIKKRIKAGLSTK